MATSTALQAFQNNLLHDQIVVGRPASRLSEELNQLHASAMKTNLIIFERRMQLGILSFSNQKVSYIVTVCCVRVMLKTDFSSKVRSMRYRGARVVPALLHLYK